MTERSMDPRRLTDSQLELVLGYARSLPPVADRIELVKTKHRADDVDEVERRLRILVKDTAKKLQTANERRRAERADVGEVEEPRSKCSSRSIFHYPCANTTRKWLNPIGGPNIAHGQYGFTSFAGRVPLPGTIRSLATPGVPPTQTVESPGESRYHRA